MEEILLYNVQARHKKLKSYLTEVKTIIDVDGGQIARDTFVEMQITLRNVLTAFTSTLQTYMDKVKDLDALVFRSYTDDQMVAEDLITRLEVISKLNPNDNQSSHSRLPKLELGKYDGNILGWTSFWDRFEANVANKNIADVEKLSYLLGSLDGVAKEAVSGLESTNRNYSVAVNILMERFGKPTAVVDAHNEALLKLDIAQNTPEDCRRTLNTIETHLRVLESLGEKVDSSHLRVGVLGKFPSEVRYQVRLRSSDDSFDALRVALNSVISAMEQSKPPTVKQSDFIPLSTPASTSTLQIRTAKRKWQSKGETSVKHADRKRPRRACTFCNENHYSEDCTKYSSYKERIGRLVNKCFKCFETGHRAAKCPQQNRKCVHCSKGHNRALCKNKTTVSTQKGNTTNGDTIKFIDITMSSTHSNEYFNPLQTAVTQIKTVEGKSLASRLLLDCGSQRSYITNRLARRLQIEPAGEDSLMIYTFGSNKPREIRSPYATITIVTKRGVERMIRVNIVPYITEKVPVSEFESPELDIMADDISVGDQIDLLIGNDLYFSFIRKDIVRLGNNTFLVDSDFGWLIAGSALKDKEKDTLSVVTYCQSHGNDNPLYTEPDLPLQTIDVNFMWTLESIGITDSPKTTCEEEAVQYFNETVKFSEGRYQVKWPWIEYPPSIPTNFGLAYGRLKGLLKRSSEEVLKDYMDILKEQLEANIIEVVDPTVPTTHPVHYLPHHMVKQSGKRGRVVYDAAAKLRNEKSLNECLYKGPSLLEDLTGLILKFRVGKIALTADVEKAFLQVGLQVQDRDVTRFLWIKDLTKEVTEDNIIQFRFCRVPFGVISSPFLLAATIRYHMSQTNRSLIPKIGDRCYVDNLVTSVDSREEALSLYTQCTELFKELGMNMRDWISNDGNTMSEIPDKQRAKREDIIKILGLKWSLQNDSLQIREDKSLDSVVVHKGITKKGVLQVMARIYDPCGFASPLVLPGKLLFQELCKRKLKWNEAVPEELLASWKEIVENLKAIRKIVIPRHVANGLNGKRVDFQLHCFTDASMNSFAAVTYLRTAKDNEVSTSFLMSKSRVTPLEDKSDLKIPRLELLGYLIGSRLLRYVKNHLGLEMSKICLWTDSQVVLAWMKSNKLLPPFVSRRVNEIKQIKNLLGVELCYVNSKDNPADIATRPELWHLKQEMWLFGPDFLLQQEIKWPKIKRNTEAEICLAGRALDVVDGPEMTMKGYEEHDMAFSDSEMVNAHIPSEPEDLYTSPSTMDMETGEETVMVIKKLQETFFPDEASGKVTALSRNLVLFLDEDGLLRSKGRLANANMSYDKKYPILIPKNTPFTSRIILKTHEDNYHVGVPHTLSIIREKYWIPQGRAQVQKILKDCLPCKKHSGGPYKLPPAPALPGERVNYSTPFTFTGLDYLGPLLVDTKNGREKRWICLLTCLAVRAIHLELVKSLTAEECLLAIRRFVAARGVPKMLISDNALQFKLTSEVLTTTYCQQNHIQWKFITQLAPWQGGFYERLVGLVKHCLKRTLDKHLLTDGQMHTVVKEIEAVLNTRPLTAVGSVPEVVLRPADFLSLGQCLEISPSLTEHVTRGTSTKIDLITGWKRGQTILKEYKEMFVSQYLPSLRDRYNHSPKQPRVTSKKCPEVGDIVQIKDDSKNRTNWKVGKITSLIIGRDGECRAAKIVVGDTEYTRSIGHLYPLEADTYGPSDCSDVSVKPDVQTETVIPPPEPMETLEAANDAEVLVPSEVEAELSGSSDLATIGEVAMPDSCEKGSVQNEQDPVTESGEAGAQPPMMVEEEAPRERREAAIRARDRITEWTRQLLTLLQ